MQLKTELNIDTRIFDNDEIAVLRLNGYIDSMTAVQLKKEIERLGKKICRFIIDFAGVEYVSSAGWGGILTRIREFRGKKGDIVFIRMSEEVNSIFELLELNQVIRYFPTIEEGFRHLGVTDPYALAEHVRAASADQKPQEGQSLTVEDAIRRIVRDNPLLTSSQIKQTLRSPAYGQIKINTIQLFFLLRRLGLNTREKRLYYAWRHLTKKLRT
jgi:anti-sigma B factor antagonist